MVYLEISCFKCCRRMLFVLVANQCVRGVIVKKSSKISRQIWLVCVKALLLHPLSERVEAQWLTWWTKRRCCRKKTSIKIWKWLDKVFIFAVRTAKKGASFSESGLPFARERTTAESLEMKKNFRKIWQLKIKSLPLHPLLKNGNQKQVLWNIDKQYK